VIELPGLSDGELQDCEDSSTIATKQFFKLTCLDQEKQPQ
jgi:hypothetical protein